MAGVRLPRIRKGRRVIFAFCNCHPLSACHISCGLFENSGLAAFLASREQLKTKNTASLGSFCVFLTPQTLLLVEHGSLPFFQTAPSQGGAFPPLRCFFCHKPLRYTFCHPSCQNLPVLHPLSPWMKQNVKAFKRPLHGRDGYKKTARWPVAAIGQCVKLYKTLRKPFFAGLLFRLFQNHLMMLVAVKPKRQIKYMP